MHIAEGFLPASHAAAWTVVAAPFVVYGAREAIKIVKEKPETGVLLAGAGAFSFVLSALKLPSVTGSSSHPTGTGLGTVLFRPPVMAFLGSLVLLFQALLLAHGGLTTLGANVFSMAVVGPWAAWGAFILAKKLGAGVLSSVFVAAFIADISTYVVTSLQLAVAFPAEEGGIAATAATFLGIFAVTQIPLAIVEALITVAIVKVLLSVAHHELDLLGFFRGFRRLPAAARSDDTTQGTAAASTAVGAEIKE